MMKNISYFLLLSTLIVSCAKKDTPCNFKDSTIVASQSEISSVQGYLSSKSITAIQHSSGLFYTVKTAGTGQEIVNLCSNVTVRYKGMLTNGVVFDSTATGNTATFQLGQVIPGWQKGLPLINAGGSITLYIPPSLAYGASSTGSIPPNSILVFDIDLVAVN